MGKTTQPKRNRNEGFPKMGDSMTWSVPTKLNLPITSYWWSHPVFERQGLWVEILSWVSNGKDRCCVIEKRARKPNDIYETTKNPLSILKGSVSSGLSYTKCRKKYICTIALAKRFLWHGLLSMLDGWSFMWKHGGRPDDALTETKEGWPRARRDNMAYTGSSRTTLAGGPCDSASSLRRVYAWDLGVIMPDQAYATALLEEAMILF